MLTIVAPYNVMKKIYLTKVILVVGILKDRASQFYRFLVFINRQVAPPPSPSPPSYVNYVMLEWSSYFEHSVQYFFDMCIFGVHSWSPTKSLATQV
jgi:hypothetical protein